MKHYAWFKKAAVVLIIVFIAAGCSDKTNESAEIDPPPYDLAALSERWTEVGTVAEEERQSTFKTTIYAKDPQGYLAPISLDIPFIEKTATQTLAFMTKGGPVEKMLPEGFEVLLPEGTEVIGMNINEGVATVDFSEPFINYDAAEERKLLESIVWTLTEFDNIESVQIWVDGHPQKEMPVAGLPTSRKLTRAIGINLEYSGSIQPSQAMPVTLYFQNEAPELESYLVPVTRMIHKTDSIYEEVVRQLILGPSSADVLQPVVSTDAQLAEVWEKDGVLELEFTESVLGDSEDIPAMALQSLALSLMETTGISEVHVQVSDHTWNETVSHPYEINRLDL